MRVWLLLAWYAVTAFGQRPTPNKRHDVYIAGFFPFGGRVSGSIPEGRVGRGVMPAVKLAVDHINENPTLLRNYRLHVWWNDTQCNAAVGLKAFFDMMHEGPHKVMLFGAACTQVTDPIAKASKHWRITQLSYADTHPMFTNTDFPNFFRVVPSENAFNAPRLALLRHFNWTKVGTIYQNEPRYALAHNQLVAMLEKDNFVVLDTQNIAGDVSLPIQKLREKDIRIILGNFNETWAKKIFCEAYRVGMVGGKYQWLIMGTYGPKWWNEIKSPCPVPHLLAALDGCILTDYLPLSTTGEITVSGITSKEYQQEYDMRRGSEYSRFHGYTYDGVWTAALAIQEVARKVHQSAHDKGTLNRTIADFQYRDHEWENLFLEALRDTSFEGVTGPVRFYNNERKASILLKQFQVNKEVKIGEYNGVTGTLDLSVGKEVKWRAGGKGPPKDQTLTIYEDSHVNVAVYIGLAVAAIIGIVIATAFLIVNIKYRDQKYIKMSSPHLNNLIIIGAMLTYSSVIFLGLNSRMTSINMFPYICAARAWLLMAGFSLAFGAMFSKTWRVHSIFTDITINKKIVKDTQLFLMVGILLCIDLGIMFTWQFSDPFYRETKQMEPYPHPHNDDIVIIPCNEYCQSDHMTVFLAVIYVYKGALMVFGAFLAWETRHVSIPALNDSKYVGMSVYNVVLMCVAGAAISFVLSDQQDASFIIISVFILFCSTATLFLVFIPKIVELKRNPQGVDKRIRATLRPMSKTYKDICDSEEQIRAQRNKNQQYRQQLLDVDREIDAMVLKIDTYRALKLSEQKRKALEEKQIKVEAIQEESNSNIDLLIEEVPPEKTSFQRHTRIPSISVEQPLSYCVESSRPITYTPSPTRTCQRRSSSSMAPVIGCNHRRPSIPQAKKTCQQPTFVHQDELWLTQTQRHANRSPPPITRGLLNNVDSPTDDEEDSSSSPTASTMHRSVSEKSSSRSRGPGLRRPSAPHMHSTPNVYGRWRESGSGGESPTDAPSVGGCHSRLPPSAASGMSRVNTLSEGELLDVAILPIFQKLLTERRAHKSTLHHHHHHRASIASCPNIAVKCDIVEYL
ncbi:gamma-aminobutyric acid type B receptor subunit 2 [Daktulosphaira vitifoliae]|uniref:gamma-aminobutyric acid type B receptor subunit 2 n=1 Tax=Daktulosphaira vitifoliae TaxID=58002 RepID=UPI0021A97AB3|nr:gamma-aminobutyric acid type B receptor subunit 2 [Daktulosphaira vitifoliae]XP_050524507.1 gamma-aminobutyric acid type B receptor subunit 2 [Daktulosphaira vitifoliae]